MFMRVVFILRTISIHAPHEGERLILLLMTIMCSLFQSTLPTRGSDELLNTANKNAAISIHAPHEGERLIGEFTSPWKYNFNPRSPRGGATCKKHHTEYVLKHFNPRSPRGGATRSIIKSYRRLKISIHAPHEGERQRKSAFVYSISANLLNIIHCGTVTRAVSRRRIALFRLFSVRRSGVFMYAYASH